MHRTNFRSKLVFFSWALAFACVLVATALASPAFAVCAPMAKPCRMDLECCPGLMCSPARICLPGCRVGGIFYRRGALNPDSSCEACDPSRTTRGWTDLPAGTTCGDPRALGECETLGRCDGSGTCLDGSLPVGTPCADDGNLCTVDRCDEQGRCGHAAGNPGVVCRDAAVECDAAERCSGTSPACPSDAPAPAGTSCEEDANPCTDDVCDGAFACRHVAGNAGALCRPGSGDVCDPAERCDGSSTICPPDVFEPDSTICRPSVGACDAPEQCSGSAGNPCPDDTVAADGTTCDAGTDAVRARTCLAGSCEPCCPDALASPRFVANGDGTVTDRATCLVWERKTDRGAVPDPLDPHDVHNRYSWSGTPSTATFLADLNGPGFAGHGDWRLPTSAGCCGAPTGQLPELESLLLVPCEGGGAPCIDAALGPTMASSPYGSASASGGLAWTVSFADGVLARVATSETAFLRAVRGSGPCSDGIRDCGETDVDCGGGACGACSDGAACAAASDCRSGVCGPDGRCRAGACDDGVRNGSETDVDCGGPACADCLPGQGCAADTDCLSQSCDPATGTCDACLLDGAGPCAGDSACCPGLQCADGTHTCRSCLPAGDATCDSSADCCDALRCVLFGTNRGKCVSCLALGDGPCTRDGECCPGRRCVNAYCR